MIDKYLDTTLQRQIEIELSRKIERIRDIYLFDDVELEFTYTKKVGGYESAYKQSYHFRDIKDFILNVNEKINNSMKKKQYKVSRVHVYISYHTKDNKEYLALNIVDHKTVVPIQTLKGMDGIFGHFFLEEVPQLLL